MSMTITTSTRFGLEQSWKPELPWDWNFYRHVVKPTGSPASSMAPAAYEILADGYWSAKIGRALIQSREGKVRGLKEFRETL